jgi:O-antigen ligase
LFSHYPAPAEQKAKWVFAGIIVFSFVTTLVSFWQITYWDLGRSLPIPALLRDLKPDANSEQGREIFGLFIGDTITHTWAAMLAMQVLTVFVFATNQRHQFLRWAGWGYAGILTAIIFRTSVRNSMVGVLVSVVIYLFMRGWRNRLALNRVFKPLVIILAGVIGLLLISAIETDSYAIVRLQQALPQFGGGQITISRASNILGRLESWEAAGRIYATHPILGAGWGSFEALAVDFGADKARPHAHNSFVQTAADFGTVGLLLLAWLMWRISRYLYVTAGRVRQNKWWRMSWELTICMFIFFLFTAFFAHPFGSPRELGIRMVLLGVLVSFSSETRP